MNNQTAPLPFFDAQCSPERSVTCAGFPLKRTLQQILGGLPESQVNAGSDDARDITAWIMGSDGSMGKDGFKPSELGTIMQSDEPGITMRCNEALQSGNDASVPAVANSLPLEAWKEVTMTSARCGAVPVAVGPSGSDVSVMLDAFEAFQRQWPQVVDESSLSVQGVAAIAAGAMVSVPEVSTMMGNYPPLVGEGVAAMSAGATALAPDLRTLLDEMWVANQGSAPEAAVAVLASFGSDGGSAAGSAYEVIHAVEASVLALEGDSGGPSANQQNQMSAVVAVLDTTPEMTPGAPEGAQRAAQACVTQVTQAAAQLEAQAAPHAAAHPAYATSTTPMAPSTGTRLVVGRLPILRRSTTEKKRRHRVSEGFRRLEKTIPPSWMRQRYPTSLVARPDMASLLQAAVAFIEELENHKAQLSQAYVQQAATCYY